MISFAIPCRVVSSRSSVLSFFVVLFFPHPAVMTSINTRTRLIKRLFILSCPFRACSFLFIIPEAFVCIKCCYVLFLIVRKNPALQDSPPAAGRFSDKFPFRRSAILPGRLFSYLIGDFIEISYEIRKKPLQILMSEETLKADVSKYVTVP